MKTIGVKKLAAIVGGAALVGTALAPLAAATVTLQKSDVYNSSMQPLVNVVVGEKASNMDVWNAGRIALAIQSGAKVTKTVSATGGTATDGTANVSGATVKVTVGGTVQLNGGAKEYITAALNSTPNTAEYSDAIQGNSTFKSFANKSYSSKVGGTSTSRTVTEAVGFELDARFDTTPPVNDLVAYFKNTGDYNYSVTFSPALPANFADNGSNDNVQVSFLGKPYVVDSINSSGSSVILVTANAEQVVQAGATFELTGRNGKTYTLTVEDGVTGKAKLKLQDDQGVVIENKFYSTGDVSFIDSSGNDLISTRVNLKAVDSTLVTGGSQAYFFTFLIGADRLEIQDSKEFPYDPNVTAATNTAWQAAITRDSNNSVTAITIKNGNTRLYDVSNPLISTDWSFKNVAGSVESVPILDINGIDGGALGKILFKGFYDAGVTKTTFNVLKSGAAVAGAVQSYGNLQYSDTSNVAHNIPFAMKLNGSTKGIGSFTFEGQNYSYAYGRGVVGDDNSSNNPNMFLLEKDPANSFGTQTGSSYADYNFAYPVDSAAPSSSQAHLLNEVNHSGNDINSTSPIISITGTNSKTYKYFFRATDEGAWLVLAGKDANSATSGLTGKVDDLYQSAGTVFFIGSMVDDANVGGSSGINVPLISNFSFDVNASGDFNSAGVDKFPYYVPGDRTFLKAESGSNTGYYRSALLQVTEGTQAAADDQNTAGSFNIFLDTQGGYAGTIDTASVGSGSLSNYSGKTVALYYSSSDDQNLSSMSAYTGSTNNYTKAYTNFGTKVVLADRELKFTVPSAQMKTYFLVESNDVTTTTTGGEELSIKWGETGKTLAGTTVTVGDITGVTVTGGSADGNASETTYVAMAESNGKPTIQTDGSSPSGSVVLVGGPAVNRLTAMIAGIDDMFQSEGAKAEITTYTVSGTPHILVAGYSESDTTAAATEFINWLESQ